jgi:predicted membrane chloride channel (bestrophin family)
MIPYKKSFLGLNLIFRINGSPVYRAAVPGLISVGIYILLEKFYILGKDDTYLDHPYGVGVLISSISFLIIFRANYGYQRYWNACGDVHHMTSKWLDAVTHTGVFHMQQKHYDPIKPPSYFHNHDLNQYGFTRDRECEVKMSKNGRRVRSIVTSIDRVTNSDFDYDSPSEHISTRGLLDGQEKAINDPSHVLSEGRKDGGWGGLFEDNTSTYYRIDDPTTWRRSDNKGFASDVGGRTPSLFLQELVHLASLCNAVAYSTLRSDIEGTEAPLDIYKAGSPWPETDPDVLKKGQGTWSAFKDAMQYLSGFDRTPAMRTAHNASRPLAVLGGVSENEIAFLQRARGPSAKVTLAWSWLSEFIIREHLNGSLGDVAPPIISRLIQFLSDGMIFYNHARKTMFIPFPFPHAQISAFFVFTIMFTVPLLMDEYATNIYIGGTLTFLTVTCLAGLHEVARELENPFRNVPNEIPLLTLQAMFNESLITLFSGFHPDHYFNPEEYRRYGKEKAQQDASLHSSTDTSSSSQAAAVIAKRVDKPQAAALNKPVSFAQLQAVVAKQHEEIQRLSNLVEGKAVTANGRVHKKDS